MLVTQLIKLGLARTHPIVKKVLARLLLFVIKVVKLLHFVVVKFYQAILNERSLKQFAKDFGVTFLFCVACLLINSSVNYLPRPDRIFFKFLYRFDSYFFDVGKLPVGAITGLLLTCLGAYIINYFYYSNEDEELLQSSVLPQQNFPLKPLQVSSLLMQNGNSGATSSAPSSRPSMSTTGSSTLSPASDLINFTEEEEMFELHASTADPEYYHFKPFHTETTNELVNRWWRKAPVILLCSCWVALNVLFLLKQPIYKTKNIIAWIFHVPVHFIVPPVIGTWLYIWHAPGALKLFTFCLGIQNIALLFTYLIFPNATPTFIKLYGDNKAPTFDMIYSDGQAVQDKKFSIFYHKAVYYATPLKFASFPSLHSAFACLICFFVCHYSRWSSFRFLSFVNVFGQWWADLYFDHHWRVDNLGGLIYAIITWTLLKNWNHSLAKVDSKFSRARSQGDFVHGSTMGMRLFRNTKLQKLFDPLS